MLTVIKRLLGVIELLVVAFRKAKEAKAKEDIANEIKIKDDDLTASELADALGVLHKGDPE